MQSSVLLLSPSSFFPFRAGSADGNTCPASAFLFSAQHIKTNQVLCIIQVHIALWTKREREGTCYFLLPLSWQRQRPLAEGDTLGDGILNACTYLQPLCMWVTLGHAERVLPFLRHPKLRTQVSMLNFKNAAFYLAEHLRPCIGGFAKVGPIHMNKS